MLIGRNWKIESDAMNITLFRRHVSKKAGKDLWAVEGYFSSLSNAMKSIVDAQLKGTGLKDLNTVMAKLESIEKKIDSALQNSHHGDKAAPIVKEDR